MKYPGPKSGVLHDVLGAQAIERFEEISAIANVERVFGFVHGVLDAKIRFSSAFAVRHAGSVKVLRGGCIDGVVLGAPVRGLSGFDCFDVPP